MLHKYNTQLDMALSPLGFGVLRLPICVDGSFTIEVHKLLSEAYERGINYFDTAYNYIGGHSEELVRDALVANYPRESFFVADKLPVWLCASIGDMEKIFRIQLKRLGVDYIDFYLLHGLNRARWTDAYSMGVLDFLEKKKYEGYVRKVGFSFHDELPILKLILDEYKWECALLQINYYDWVVQKSKEKYNLLTENNIPCFVMEPVGGGRLVNLPKNAEKLIKSKHPNDSSASWALRFAASLPNVAVILSGMSNKEQLSENITVFSPVAPLSDSEQAILNDVLVMLNGFNTIPCTSCRYCLDDCPSGIAIPQIFQIFNDYKIFNQASTLKLDYLTVIPESQRIDKCKHCNKCIDLCPQRIDIPSELRMILSTIVELLMGMGIEELLRLVEDDSDLVCFGAGLVGCIVLSTLHEHGCEVDYFCDNAKNLWGTMVKGVPVISPDQLEQMHNIKKTYVLITVNNYHNDIEQQLEELGIDIINQKGLL